MGREFFTVAVSLDDDLVAGVGQPVQDDVAEDRVVEEAESFLHSPIAVDDEAGQPMPVEQEFLETRTETPILSKPSFS